MMHAVTETTSVPFVIDHNAIDRTAFLNNRVCRCSDHSQLHYLTLDRLLFNRCSLGAVRDGDTSNSFVSTAYQNPNSENWASVSLTMNAQVASGTVGGPVMELGDWRAQQQSDSRERMRNQILDTLKRHLPFSGHEELQEPKKIAERVEEEIYAAATSQHEYSRKICFMMLALQTRLQNPISDPVRSNSAALYDILNRSVPLDSIANGGDWQEEVYQKIKAMKDPYLLDSTVRNPNGETEDWQEEVYKKIKIMKDLYLLDLKDMHQKVLSKLQQHDSLLHQSKNAQIEKLKIFKGLLEHRMQFLQIPKHEIPASYTDKLRRYEKQIVDIINSNRQLNLQGSMAQMLQSNKMPIQQQSSANLVPAQVQQSHPQLQQLVMPHMPQQQSTANLLQSSKMPIQQQSSANLVPTQVQQSHPQLQQLVMPHMQSQPGQLRHLQQVGIQQPPNLLQRDMQQRLPTAGGFQNPNMIDMEKRLCPQKRAMPEASSTSLGATSQTGNPNDGDWHEEVYQKIKAMKDLYLLDLNDMHQKILSKLQQHDSLTQQPKNEQLEKLKVFKNMVERFMQFLQIPKHGILPNYKDRLGTYEKQIVSIINSNRRKPATATPQQQPQACIAGL